MGNNVSLIYIASLRIFAITALYYPCTFYTKAIIIKTGVIQYTEATICSVI